MVRIVTLVTASWLAVAGAAAPGAAAPGSTAATPGAAAAAAPAPGGGTTAKREPATPPLAVPVLRARTDIEPAFSAARGKVRVVAFLSPTCSHCIANAQRFQRSVLDPLAGEDLFVQVVWLKVMETDSAEQAAGARAVFTDPRVQHYWDEKRLLNPWLLDAIGFDVQVRLYDVFLLYGRDVAWVDRLPRPSWWMHEFRGAPGPMFDAPQFAQQVKRALQGLALEMPE